MKQGKIKLTMTLPIDIVTTLQGFIDGGIGTYECDEFNKHMHVVLRKLDNSVKRYYKNKKK